MIKKICFALLLSFVSTQAPGTPPATPAATPALPAASFSLVQGMCTLGGDPATPTTVAAISTTVVATADACLKACIDEATCLSAMVQVPSVPQAGPIVIPPVSSPNENLLELQATDSTSCIMYTEVLSGTGVASIIVNTTQNCYTKKAASGGAVFWVVGILLVLFLGGGLFYYLKKTGKIGGDGEGGQVDDMYSKLL